MQTDPAIASRQRWLAVLARAGSEELARAWDALAPTPTFRRLRPAESGLIMLRGRIGGSGAKFNVGEASVTRCTVQTDDGYVGVSYVLGRDHRRAELAALFDALLQDPARQEQITRTIVEPLAAAQQQQLDAASRKSAATKVEFYTLARGDAE